MITLTSIIRKFFEPRQRELEKMLTHSEELQHDVLQTLLERAQNTEYGRNHVFDRINGYDEFVKHVPVNTYEELKNDIDRMRQGERDVLWPGQVRWYAKSSGTTNDKSKFIPVSSDGLKYIHYAGGKDAVALYLKNNPNSRLFDGRALILGGSHAPNYNLKDSLVGDLSAILIENINPLVNLVRVPKKKTALLSDFESKREMIAQEALHKNVTNISGVPSWMLSVLTRMMEISGKAHLEEVWPNIEVFFHGGVAFTPYRKQYEQLITSPNMHYMETYNASEGFFGLQDDPTDKSMLLMADYDVFYEFMDLTGNSGESGSGNIVPLWGVETGKNYAMLITTSCGLWRYEIGDTVMFTSTNPYKFIITGRTKHFIMLLVRNSLWIMLNKDWRMPVSRQVLRCWSIPLLLSIWTIRLVVVTSGSSSFRKPLPTCRSLPPCSTVVCRKSIVTMRRSAIRTSPCSILRLLRLVRDSSTNG